MRLLFVRRSEEHTSELQSHSFISYAVFCLKKKKNTEKQNKLYKKLILTIIVLSGNLIAL